MRRASYRRPYGGPLSPILSNVVLDELDRELARRGLRFVRYADDCNIFVGSRRAGERVMASISAFLEQRMRLKVNVEKSAVRALGEGHFLGFCFRRKSETDDRVEVGPSRKAAKRLGETIRTMTPGNWGRSLQACMDGLSRYLNGWMAHFRLCTPEGAEEFKRFDAHIRRRLRAIVVRQKKRPRFLYRHLVRQGASHKAALGAAYCGRGVWHRSNRPGMTRTYPPSWFTGRLVSLQARWKELNSPRVSNQLTLVF